jgi:hypothetical protein
LRRLRLRCSNRSRGRRERDRHRIERAATRGAVAKVRSVGRVADLAPTISTRLRRDRRGQGMSVGAGKAKGGGGARSDDRRRSVDVLAPEADRRRRRRDARSKPLATFLAERQVSRVVTSTRRAGHDVVGPAVTVVVGLVRTRQPSLSRGLPRKFTFPVGDNTTPRPSSGLHTEIA